MVSSVTVGILCVIITFAVTRIPYYQFGKVDSGQFFINAEASITSSVRDTERLAMKLEKVVLSELNENELESLYTNVGVSFKDFSRFDLGSQYIQIVVSLKKSSPQGFVDYVVTPLFNLSFDSYGKRDRSEKEIINSLRQKISSVSGLQKVSIKKAEGGPGGSDIVIGVVGQNQKVLTKYAKEIEDFLSRIDGVKDVEQDQESPSAIHMLTNQFKELDRDIREDQVIGRGHGDPQDDQDGAHQDHGLPHHRGQFPKGDLATNQHFHDQHVDRGHSGGFR